MNKSNNSSNFSTVRTNAIRNEAKIISCENILGVERTNTVNDRNSLLLQLLLFKEMVSTELYKSNYKNKNLTCLYEMILSIIVLISKIN